MINDGLNGSDFAKCCGSDTDGTSAVCSSGRDAERIRCVVSEGDRTAYLSIVVYIEVVVLLVRKMIKCGPTLVMTVC